MNVSIIFAPPIVFQNIIVCGQAIEINIINDLDIKLYISDLRFLKKLHEKLSIIVYNKNIGNLNDDITAISTPNPNEQLKSKFIRQSSLQRISSNADQFDSDSGFKSNWCNDKLKIGEKRLSRVYPTLPRIFSFVGGVFTFEIFSENALNDNSSELLLSIRLQQPNIFTQIDSNEQVQRVCLYDISVNLHIEQTFKKTEKLFDGVILSTQCGETTESGIMPPLIDLKEIRKKNEAKIICALKKSLQINIQPQSVEKLMHINDIIGSIFISDNKIMEKKMLPIARYNKIRKIRKNLSNITTIEFSMTRLATKLITSKYSFLNLCAFKCDGKVRIIDITDQIVVSASCGSIALNSENSMILNPAALEFDCIFSEEKWDRRLNIAMNLQSNIFDLQISPTDIQTLAKVQVEFTSCLNRQSKVSKQEKDKIDADIGTSDKINYTKLVPIILPEFKTKYEQQQDDQFFQDDLRYLNFSFLVTLLSLTFRLYV